MNITSCPPALPFSERDPEGVDGNIHTNWLGFICTSLLPPIRGSQPEVIRSWCCVRTTHPPAPAPKVLRRPFERARHAHAPPTARRRRVWPARRWRETLEWRRRRSRAALLPHEPPYRRSARAWRRRWQHKVLAVCHPTLALGRSSKHALHRASRAARSAQRLRHPHSPPGDNACATGGAHVGARARSAPAFGAERVARGSDPAATGARAHTAPTPSRRHKRVTRGDAGSRCAAVRSLAAPLSHPHPCTLGGSCLLAQL